jgi:hypothetical protein
MATKLTSPSLISPITGQPKTSILSQRPSTKLGKPLPVVAGEAAKLDGLTRPHIKNLQRELAALRKHAQRATGPLEQIQLRRAIRNYRHALAVLRHGPHGADPSVDTPT